HRARARPARLSVPHGAASDRQLHPARTQGTRRGRLQASIAHPAAALGPALANRHHQQAADGRHGSAPQVAASTANAINARTNPAVLRTVTRSRRMKIPSTAATTNPICEIGTNTLAWPPATPFSRKIVAPSSAIEAAAAYLNVMVDG